MEDTVQVVVTHDDLLEIKSKSEQDLANIRVQISVLQARAAAVESQIARIEPTVEARNSKTEKLVMELQIEISKMQKDFGIRYSKEQDHHKIVEDALKVLLQRGTTP